MYLSLSLYIYIYIFIHGLLRSRPFPDAVRFLDLLVWSRKGRRRVASPSCSAAPGYTVTCMYIYLYIYLVRQGNRQDVCLWFPSSTTSNIFVMFSVVCCYSFRRRRKRFVMVFVVGFCYGFRRGRKTFVYGFRRWNCWWILPLQEDPFF